MNSFLSGKVIKLKINFNSDDYLKELNDQLNLISTEDLQSLINRCTSWKELLIELDIDYENLPKNKIPNIKKKILSKGIDCSHFTSSGKKSIKEYTKEELQEIVNSSKSWEEISKKIGFNRRYCRKYCVSIGIDFSKLPRVQALHFKKWDEYSKEELEQAVKESLGWEDLYKRLHLNLNVTTKPLFKERIENLGIDTSHFPRRGGPRTRPDIRINIPYEVIKETALNSNSFKETYEKLGIPLNNGVYRRKLKKDGIDETFFQEKGYQLGESSKFTLEQLKEAIKTSNNWQETSEKLGFKGVQADIYDKAILLSIDYSHFYPDRYEDFKELNNELIKQIISQSITWEEVCRKLNIPLNKIEVFRSYVVSLGISFDNLKKSLNNPSEELIKEISIGIKTKKDLFRNLISLGYVIGSFNFNKLLNEEILKNFNYKRLYQDIAFTDEELADVIKSSYSWYEVCEKLGYPFGVWNYKPRDRAVALNLDFSHFDYKQLNSLSKHSDKEIREAIRTSVSFREAARKLGFNYISVTQELSTYVKNNNIDTSHFYRTGDGILDELKKFSNEKLQAMIDSSFSWVSLCKNLGFKGTSSVFKSYLIEQGIDLSKYRIPTKWTTELVNQKLDEIYGEGNITLIGEYKGYNRGLLLFRCKEHGLFRRTLSNILNGDGCPHCRGTRSIGEQSIKNFFDKNNLIAEVDYLEQKRFKDCRLINALSFDFYIPSLNICIEFQGYQHLHPVRYDLNQTDEEVLAQFEYQLERDRIKKEYCENNNIQLIEVFNFKEIPKKLGFIVEKILECKTAENQPQEDFSTKLNEVNSQ